MGRSARIPAGPAPGCVACTETCRDETGAAMSEISIEVPGGGALPAYYSPARGVDRTGARGRRRARGVRAQRRHPRPLRPLRHHGIPRGRARPARPRQHGAVPRLDDAGARDRPRPAVRRDRRRARVAARPRGLHGPHRHRRVLPRRRVRDPHGEPRFRRERGAVRPAAPPARRGGARRLPGRRVLRRPRPVARRCGDPAGGGARRGGGRARRQGVPGRGALVPQPLRAARAGCGR